MSTYGFHGKILRVDLSENKVWEEKKDEAFFRKYLGGGALGSYYIIKNVKPGTDAFHPNNIIVFSGSIISGEKVAGLTRHSVTSISPLTGGIADSEAGGYWARELKAAGFDAIVVQGKAEKPVYLYINNGVPEIKDASYIWGKTTGETQELIRKKHEQENIRVLTIGQAGENRVRYACIVNELRYVNGRGGLGAVMGSKNLKAIAVFGKCFPKAKYPEKVKKISRSFRQSFMDYVNNAVLKDFGTSISVKLQNETGQLPSYNWKTGTINSAEKISGEEMKESIVVSDTGCYACPVLCKKNVRTKEPYNVDPKYGGPEYETISCLGSYTGITNLHAIAKGNELCNKYTLDSISTGQCIAYAMECFERGVLSKEDTDGIELRFGNAEVMLEMIEKIAKREGIGNFLAEGVKRMSEKLGDNEKGYAMHCKGLEFPAHEPRVKKSLALAYAIAPIGADHMCSEHDVFILPGTDENIIERMRMIGISEPLELDDLGHKKVKFFYHTHLIRSLFNSLDVCMFCMAPTGGLGFSELVQVVNAITGWETSLWELVQVGDRRLQMMRAFNCSSGMTEKDDMLPKRMYQSIESGVTKGQKLDEKEFLDALKLFYELMGWSIDGKPKKSRLRLLDLDWIIAELDDHMNI